MVDSTAPLAGDLPGSPGRASLNPTCVEQKHMLTAAFQGLERCSSLYKAVRVQLPSLRESRK